VKTIEDFRRVSKQGSEKVKTLVGELAACRRNEE
jgi:hypothetical protein